MRGATPCLAAMLLTAGAHAWAGTIDTISGPIAPLAGSSDVGRPSSILYTAPASVTGSPAATAGGKAGLAAGISAGEHGASDPEGGSNGTVRMLLSPPPRGSGDED